jgi:membrane protease YdiL (CAAX protease family)
MKKTRLYDLLLVSSIAFLPAIIKSIYVLAGGEMKYYSDQLAVTFFIGAGEHALSILLLFYVLFNRNLTYGHIGLGISFKDILYGLGLAILATAVVSISSFILRSILPMAYANQITARNVSFLYNGFSWSFLIYLLINPFFEELIVRGYLMTEIFTWSKSKALAIIVSVLIQSAYHLYQGIFQNLILATIFLLYAIFYSKTGKLTPVIVAHLIADLAILTRAK